MWLGKVLLQCGFFICFLETSTSSTPSQIKKYGAIIKSLSSSNIETNVIDNVLDAVESCQVSWSIAATPFLNIMEYDTLSRNLKNLVDVSFVAYGGIDNADRVRLFLKRSSLSELSDTDFAINDSFIDTYFSAVRLKGNFLFESITPKGITQYIEERAGTTKDTIGDVFITGDTGANLIVTPATKDALLKAPSSAVFASIPITIEALPIAELITQIKPKLNREITLVEASMRLDAVASGGLNISRSKLTKLIDAGLVSVNGVEVKWAATILKVGNIVTVYGAGRLTILSVDVTSKGRYRVQMLKTA